MRIYHFCTSVNDANAYIVVEPDTKEALVVDVPEWTADMEQVLAEEHAQLMGVFITHGHYDHTSGLRDLFEKYPRIQRYPKNEFFSSKGLVHSRFTLGKWECRILSLPGHTLDSVGLRIGKVVFTGDALFAGSVGGTVNDAQSRSQIESIHREILTLSDDTFIFPGHGPITSVGIERKYNPFL